MKKLIAVFALLTAAAFGQSINPTGGLYAARNYGQWQLEFHDATASGSQAVILVPVGSHSIAAQNNSCFVGLVGGTKQSIPLVNGMRINISDGSNSETAIALTALSTTNGICTATATFSNAHSAGALVTSGSGGLDEALSDVSSASGGVVVTDPLWGGTTAQLTNGTVGNANTFIHDERGSQDAFYGFNGTNYVKIAAIPATLPTDGVFFVSESACSGATSGTAGAGNATDILAGSGGARVFRVSATNAAGSTNTFTCVFQVPSRLTSGKGITITDVTFLVSSQTTQPTSVTLPTLKSFSPPAASDPETANSATFVTAGGTITLAPSSAQFAAYSAVAAGQFYSLKVSLGTPLAVNTDLQTLQLVIPFVQSASAASLQETPGFYVHYKLNSLF